MNDRLLSPPPARSAAAGMDMWMELVQLGDELVQAGFRHKFGPDDWLEPYRQWWAKRNKEKDQRLVSMLSRLALAETRHA